MKRIALILIMGCSGLKAQETVLEKSVFGVQTGILGTWIHHELLLQGPLVLRTEVGLNMGFWGGLRYGQNNYLMTPVLTLEPRYYYNIRKRIQRGDQVQGNAANFFALNSRYHPGWFVVSNENVSIIPDISIIPTWGIRRNFGDSNFNFETAIGFGYQYLNYKHLGFANNEWDTTMNAHIRIGYRF